MGKLHKDIRSLQQALKGDLIDSIEKEINRIAIEVVQRYLDENVYENGSEPSIYQRTRELRNSVRLSDIKAGYKYLNFEIFMDTSLINPYETDDAWNQHANVDYTQDTSEYIPLWVEEGTFGSLHDRKPAWYMRDSYNYMLPRMHRDLASALRKRGWKVTVI